MRSRNFRPFCARNPTGEIVEKCALRQRLSSRFCSSILILYPERAARSFYVELIETPPNCAEARPTPLGAEWVGL